MEPRVLLLAAAVLGRIATDAPAGARADASRVLPARAIGRAPDCAPRFNRLVHGDLRGGDASPGAGSAMVVRVRTRDGVLRVSVPVDGDPTVADLQRLIGEQLGIAVSAQTSLARAGAVGAPSLKPDKTLAAAGVAHGALLVLEYEGDAAPSAAYSGSATPGAPPSSAGAGGAGRRPRARKLDDLVADQLAVQIRLESPGDAACRFVSVDEASCARFLRACRADGFASPRVAYLYGRVVSTGRSRKGLEIAAVHAVPLRAQQPPQPEPVAAEVAGGAAGAAFEPPPECARARALAAHLGLRRVGWLLVRRASAHKLSAAELVAAARLQAEAEAEGAGDEEAAEAAPCFVTLIATPRRARAKGRALSSAAAGPSDGAGGAGSAGDRNSAELTVEAYQPTASFVSLVREGKVRPALRPAAAAAAAAADDLAALIEPARAELAFVSSAGAARPGRTAPVEYFVARVFELTQPSGWLASAFGHEPAYEPRRGVTGGAAPSESTGLSDTGLSGAGLSDAIVHEVRDHLRRKKSEPLDEVLLDWRLLLCVSHLLTDEQLGELCDAALEADTAGLLRAHRQLHQRIIERIGPEDEDE